jgi:seryl-tRNA synthetase
MVGLDAALIMNPKVWEASGHLATFTDPLVECKECHERYRADQIDLTAACAKCGRKGTFTEPDMSPHEHALLLACEEALMQGLGLHYRVVRLCTGDIGQASAATYDIETWMPGQGEYRETHSTSNTTDYQSRALKTRYRVEEGKTETVHMLNGTVFSMNRPIVAILEQFQNEDGTVRVPEVLRPYMGGLEVIGR